MRLLARLRSLARTSFWRWSSWAQSSIAAGLSPPVLAEALGVVVVATPLVMGGARGSGLGDDILMMVNLEVME